MLCKYLNEIVTSNKFNFRIDETVSFVACNVDKLWFIAHLKMFNHEKWAIKKVIDFFYFI